MCDAWLGSGLFGADGPALMIDAPINFPSCVGEPLMPGVTYPNPYAASLAGGQPNPNQFNTENVAKGVKSKHPGGANVVFCDGSVHFLPETIAFDTYARLGNRRDAKVVPPGSY